MGVGVFSKWLTEQQAEEVVLESTAQYWKPVWETLERYWKPICEKREGAGRMSGTLHLAQALSNRGRRGRKRDFRDAERLVKRLVSRNARKLEILTALTLVKEPGWITAPTLRVRYLHLSISRVALYRRLACYVRWQLVARRTDMRRILFRITPKGRARLAWLENRS